MENCLVTKLKGSVNNDNLDYINKITLSVHTVDSPSADTQVFNILPEIGETIDVEVVGGYNYITTNSDFTTGLTNKITFDGVSSYSENKQFYVANVDCKINITKYKVHTLGTINTDNTIKQNGSAYSLKMDSIIFSNIKFLSLGNSDWQNFEKLSDVIKKNVVEYLYINYNTKGYDLSEIFKAGSSSLVRFLATTSDVKVDLKCFTKEKYPNLTTINLVNGTGIYLGEFKDVTAPVTTLSVQGLNNVNFGNLEDFVRAQRAVGRTTGECFFGGYIQYQFSWKGSRFVGTGTNLTWTSNTMTFNNETQDI